MRVVLSNFDYWMAPLVDSSAATSLTMTIDQCFRDAVVAVIAEDGKDVIPVDGGAEQSLALSLTLLWCGESSFCRPNISNLGCYQTLHIWTRLGVSFI